MDGLSRSWPGAGRAGFLASTLVALALPSAVLAQSPGNPLAPGVPLSSASTPTTTVPTVITSVSSSTAGGSGLSGSGAIVIALGAVVVLAGISFFIWRDARRRAPVRQHGPAMTSGREDGRELPGSKRTKPRKLSPAERRRRKRGRARR